MFTRREFLKQTTTATLATAAAAPLVHAGENVASRSAGLTTRRNSSHTAISRIKSVVRREETVLRCGGVGDNWHMSWGFDDRQYVSLCDGVGFSDQPKKSYNSRLFAISGGPHGAKFHDVPSYPMLGPPTQKPNDTRYYNFGTIALGGYIYQFLSTFNRPFGSTERSESDPANLMRFNGVKLIYSPNNCRTWHNQNGSTPVVWESWGHRSRNTLVFFEEDQDAFSLLSVLQMGKDYEHNKDGYVYVYAPNGNTDGTMNELVMFRVAKNMLLDRASYEYFAGANSSGGARWTKDIEERGVVCTFPRGWVNTVVHPYAWHPSVIYNAPLRLYMMANWGMGIAPDGAWFGRPSYLGFWVATNPWGPWTQVYEEAAWIPAGDAAARAYQPQIAPKWIAADGKSFWLVWTDFQGHNSEELRRSQQEYKRKADANVLGEADIELQAALVRKYMPYYAFNAQRVDLVLA